MPIYEYECQKCKKLHEVMQKITEKPLSKCPDCGGRMKKMISNSSFVLKGTGWYATDYASNKGTTAVSGKKTEITPDKKSEASTETTSEKKSETTKAAAAG